MLEKIRGSLMGARIGDALGMPVETMTHKEIMQQNGGLGIVNFVDPIQRKITEMTKLRAGDTTDDWQLTEVMAESIIASHGWNQEDCAKRHVIALEDSKFGWGKTTEISVREIGEGKRNLAEMPKGLGPNKGCGNGIAMKVSPLALYHFMRYGKDDGLERSVMELSLITHPDLRAGFAAHAIALMLCEILERPIVEISDGLERLDRIVEKVETLEIKWLRFVSLADPVSYRLKKVRGVINNPERIREVLGTSFNALHTAPFTLATFIRHSTDFSKGVLEAVNAGGDTDTHGSIVGAMIGANVGIDAIPHPWKTFRVEYRTAISLAGALAMVAKE